MALRVQFVRMEAREAGATYDRQSGEGYSIPHRGGLSVTFQINEPNGSYLQLTEVVHHRVSSYDEAVQAAFHLLERRLGGFARTAEELRQQRERRIASRAAEPPSI